MVHPTTPNQEVALWQGQSDDGETEPGMKAGIMKSSRCPATSSEATEGCRGHGVQRYHGN